MNASEHLRATARFKLRVTKRRVFYHQAHCLVLADSLEEEGNTRLATFWRLVAEQRIWPEFSRLHHLGMHRNVPSTRVFEWHCPPDDWYYQATPEPHWVRPRVFALLKGKERDPQVILPIKYFPSLIQAILALEEAWSLA